MARMPLPPGVSIGISHDTAEFAMAAIRRWWQRLETLEIVVSLIGSTTTTTGLEVHAWLDAQIDEKGRKVSKEELSEVIIKRNKFHGEWNYEIHPRIT